jgi:hypothetical protein
MSSALPRYEKLIASLIPKGDSARLVPSAGAIPIDLGITGPIVDLPLGASLAVVDAAGHARPVYRSLLVCSWLRLPSAKDFATALRAWIDTLDESPLAWLARAMAADVLGNDRWRERAASVFHQLAQHQQPTGALLPIDRSANPETRWYEELMLLHALGGYAAMRPDPELDDAIKRAALFHQEETQPDHASSQPWALLAFAQYSPPLADQVLHAMAMQYPAGVRGVPLLLLNDALYGLRLLTRRKPPMASAV